MQFVVAPLLSERDPASGSTEQGHTNRLLKFPEVPRDTGLTDPEFAGDRREAAAFGHPNEGPHALKSDFRLIHFSAQSYAFSTSTA
jgi:hypothetical protein